MILGFAACLLVFAGIWHLTEWLMAGRSRDTLRLVPFGIVYLVLGWMIALGTGGWIVGALGGVAAGIGGTVAVVLRKTLTLRRWVLWSFVVIDVLIVASVLASFSG